jgi:uncharacterized protein YraI
MRLRTLFAAAAVAGALLASPAAEAGQTYVTASVALRAGPGASYGVIAVVPTHARVRLYRCATWCELSYGRFRGYASAEFIAVGRDKFANRLLITPVKTQRGTIYTPIYVKPQDAYISTTLSRCHGAVARIWYYDGRWFDRPDYFLIVQR